MAQDSFEVTTYLYYLWSSRQTGKANLVLKGGGKTCSVWFIEDEAAALPVANQQANDYFQFWYHYADFDRLIDLLRNEKPVFVFFNDENGFNNSRISTTDEPTGEGEL